MAFKLVLSSFKFDLVEHLLIDHALGDAGGGPGEAVNNTAFYIVRIIRKPKNPLGGAFFGFFSIEAAAPFPGTAPPQGQTPLPDDLEQAAVEQVAYWFQTRDKLGLKNYWPSGGIYLAFTGADLLPSVKAVLSRYQRWTL